MEINPKEIRGNWNHGWALDLHTLSSTSSSHDERSGSGSFDSTRSVIGEAIYQLKYKNDQTQVEPVADTIAAFIQSRPELRDVQALLAVPPSNESRTFQPVLALTSAIGTRLGIPTPTDYLLKIKQTSALKSITDKRQRHAELEGAFAVADNRYERQHVLVFDDLFRSGETLSAVCSVLIGQGKIGIVSVVTATITRSKR
jgi:competence protein ComFC